MTSNLATERLLTVQKRKKMHRTVFVALIYRGPYGAAVEHAHAHVIPLQITWILDVVINLSMQRWQTCYAAVTVLSRSWSVLLSCTFDIVRLSPTISLSAVYHSCHPAPRPLKLLQLWSKEVSPDCHKGSGRGSGYGVWQKRMWLSDKEASTAIYV